MYINQILSIKFRIKKSIFDNFIEKIGFFTIYASCNKYIIYIHAIYNYMTIYT